MDDFQKLLSVETKFNDSSTIVLHRNFKSRLNEYSQEDIFKRIIKLEEENFEEFQRDRLHNDVVTNLEIHSLRISNGIKEQIQCIQDLKEENKKIQEQLQTKFKYINNNNINVVMIHVRDSMIQKNTGE